jgi:hypothetical protein
MWKPRRLTSLWATMASHRDSFTFYLPGCLFSHNIEFYARIQVYEDRDGTYVPKRLSYLVETGDRIYSMWLEMCTKWSHLWTRLFITVFTRDRQWSLSRGSVRCGETEKPRLCVFASHQKTLFLWTSIRPRRAVILSSWNLSTGSDVRYKELGRYWWFDPIRVSEPHGSWTEGTPQDIMTCVPHR